jgi:hypothetical protein
MVPNSRICAAGLAALPLQPMTPEIIPFVRESEDESIPSLDSNMEFERIRLNLLATHGLWSHLRQLQGGNHGIARWIALAVFTGTIAVLAFVSLLGH